MIRYLQLIILLAFGYMCWGLDRESGTSLLILIYLNQRLWYYRLNTMNCKEGEK
jgi:hypothetical protein